MDRLRQLLAQINAQLGVLTLSQRVSIGLCAALVVVSMLWLLRWTTSPDMVALTNYEFTLDQMSTAREVLDGSSKPYKIVGKKIFVRERDKSDTILRLNEAQALPEGALLDMEILVGELDPFIGPDQLKLKENYARGNTLAKIISAYDFVDRASVMINPARVRRYPPQSSDVPTASVSVLLRSSREMNKKLVDSFARLVSGAVAGLKPWNVNVTDERTGRSFSPPHPDDAASGDLYDMERKREADYKNKIFNALGIAGLLAEVSVELDPATRETRKLTHGKPTPKAESRMSDEKSTADQPAETGMHANTGVALTAGASNMNQLKEEETTEFFPGALTEEQLIREGYGSLRTVTAAVNIPKSYIVSLYEASKKPTLAKDAKDNPAQVHKAKTIADIETAEVERVKATVMRIIKATSENDVVVDVYPDVIFLANGEVTLGGATREIAKAAAASDGVGTMELVRGYGPQVGLGFLALASMFMMLRLVKKSADIMPEKPPGHSDEDDDEGPLSVGPHPIGEAEISDGFLAGREVDEETLKHQQLKQELDQLVRDDPVGASELIRRWIEEND